MFPPVPTVDQQTRACVEPVTVSRALGLEPSGTLGPPTLGMVSSQRAADAGSHKGFFANWGFVGDGQSGRT